MSAETLMEAARRARSEHRLGDAHRYLVEAVALCRAEDASPLLAPALKQLGQIRRDQGHGNAALPLYEEAASIAREANDTLMIAHTVRHIGDVHQDAGRLELAEPHYHEALALYRSHEKTHPLDLANAVRPLALLKQRLGQPEGAMLLWTEARDLYAAAGVQDGVAEAERRLAQLRGDMAR